MLCDRIRCLQIGWLCIYWCKWWHYFWYIASVDAFLVRWVSNSISLFHLDKRCVAAFIWCARNLEWVFWRRIHVVWLLLNKLIVADSEVDLSDGLRFDTHHRRLFYFKVISRRIHLMDFTSILLPKHMAWCLDYALITSDWCDDLLKESIALPLCRWCVWHSGVSFSWLLPVEWNQSMFVSCSLFPFRSVLFWWCIHWPLCAVAHANISSYGILFSSKFEDMLGFASFFFAPIPVLSASVLNPLACIDTQPKSFGWREFCGWTSDVSFLICLIFAFLFLFDLWNSIQIHCVPKLCLSSAQNGNFARGRVSL